MRHVRLVVQYDGAAYAGFQVQPACPTVQLVLEQALTRLLGETVRVRGASRTDAGVHACGQVITFTTENVIPLNRIVPALNALLPSDIAVTVADEVSLEFDPRRHARRKRYLYRILNRDLPSPFIGRYAWHLQGPLDVAAMQQAAVWLVGKHDFAAFCAAGGSASHTVREIFGLDVRQCREIIEISVSGNAFLYMMVRIIVGTLVEVGKGKLQPEQVGAILGGRDRGLAGATAPPCGLTLMTVEY